MCIFFLPIILFQLFCYSNWKKRLRESRRHLKDQRKSATGDRNILQEEWFMQSSELDHGLNDYRKGSGKEAEGHRDRLELQRQNSVHNGQLRSPSNLGAKGHAVGFP